MHKIKRNRQNSGHTCMNNLLIVSPELNSSNLDRELVFKDRIVSDGFRSSPRMYYCITS